MPSITLRQVMCQQVYQYSHCSKGAKVPHYQNSQSHSERPPSPSQVAEATVNKRDLNTLVATLLYTLKNRANLAQHPVTLGTPERAIKQKVANGLVAIMALTIGRRCPAKTVSVHANWCIPTSPHRSRPNHRKWHQASSFLHCGWPFGSVVAVY